MSHRLWPLLLAALLGATSARAQSIALTAGLELPLDQTLTVAEAPGTPPVAFTVDLGETNQDPVSTQPVAPEDGSRACPGCPPRRLGTSFLQVTLVNGIYELANLARGQVTAEITPATWWTNMKRGWEWDLDDFAVNQIGHPYQGNNYFTTGRANGLDFWESSALTAFGSGTWEYFGETNQASLNDFLNTTLGGIALGEMFHRTAWLVRNTSLTGRSRRMREIAAAAIDPMTGYNRFRSGDASRVVAKPPDMQPSRLAADVYAGALWRDADSDEDSGTHPFFEVELSYGDLTTGRSRTPYDAFAVRLDFGGGAPFSEARVRGRLLGQPFRDGALQMSVAQGYQYNNNDAYQFGAQSVEASLGVVKRLGSRMSLWAVGWGGVTILGAVDSMPLEGEDGEPAEPAEPEESPGQGVSTGPRFYDYGPGTNAGGYLSLLRDQRSFLTVSYELHHLRVLDGVRANHVLQRARADLTLLLRGSLGVGVSGEFFDRRTLYQAEGVSPARFYFPQIRTFLTWTAS
jgi:hypothetical protein